MNVPLCVCTVRTRNNNMCTDPACIVPRMGARPPRRAAGGCPVAGASHALHVGPPCVHPAGHPGTSNTCTLVAPTSTSASSPRLLEPDWLLSRLTRGRRRHRVAMQFRTCANWNVDTLIHKTVYRRSRIAHEMQQVCTYSCTNGVQIMHLQLSLFKMLLKMLSQWFQIV